MSNTEKTIDQDFKKLQNFLGANKGCLVRANGQEEIPVISSGSYGLDKILGVGGWPRGRISEIYGAESTGKSTLTFKAIAECQKLGGNVVYVDLEGSFDPKWSAKNNVDVNKLIISYPESGEQAFTIINALVKTKMIDLIVVDSVAAMVPMAEFKCDIQDQMIGAHARMMGRGIRLLQAALLENAQTAIIFVNQIRTKMGNSYLPGVTTPGGYALKFAASVRVELKRFETIRDGAESLGHYIKATIMKNKLAAPLKSELIPLTFDSGFDHEAEVIEHAIKQNIIQKNGAWYVFENKTLAQGLKKLKEKIRNDLELSDKIASLLN